MDTVVAKGIHKCDSNSPLKRSDYEVLGKGYSIDDEEVITIQEVSDVWIFEYRKSLTMKGKDELFVEYENGNDIGTSHNRLAQNKFKDS
ncbi:hypothetical protein C2G38_2214948 [Gigaspora rosea]|uniref:Uncharacterized protein n=1 Tax=Gigaspora rosea TaxID=44941 RepID=A0A397UJD9_9GLOM|nr:hypothetical protein C2G38_2214948 [Gigaspora rosea]